MDLNLPPAQIKRKEDKIWERIRKKYIKSTPEEEVRQRFISYLIDHLGYPEGRMVSEYKVVYNGMNKRCDIAIFNADMKCQVIVECKAPKIKITEDTFYQIAKYAFVLKAPILILTNGLNHYCAIVDQTSGEIQYMENIPTYQEIKTTD